MKISVLICTRNRAASLQRTLESVFAQRLDENFDYEVVVVDNGSSDGTRGIVEEFVTRHPRHMRYHFESRPGLAQARNAGLQAAGGEIIAFTDDDVLVQADWLNEIRRQFESDPELGMLTGRVLPAREGLQPVALQLSEEPRTVSNAEDASMALGANTAFRRAVFDACGVFDTRLGAGAFFAGAEEVEMAYRAMRAGFQLRYAPQVTVYHDHDRTSVAHACALEYGYGKGHVAYLLKHILSGDRYAMRIAYWDSISLIKRCLRSDEETPAAPRFARAHLRGMAVALLPALWRMRQTKETHGLTQKYRERPGTEMDGRIIAARRSRP